MIFRIPIFREQMIHLTISNVNLLGVSSEGVIFAFTQITSFNYGLTCLGAGDY